MFAAVGRLIVDFLLERGRARLTEHVDVAVIGSGAAGLVAACRAADGGRSVVVLEKADLLGGTSAVSGGVMWMPDNHLMGEALSPTPRRPRWPTSPPPPAARCPTSGCAGTWPPRREAVRWLDERDPGRG